MRRTGIVKDKRYLKHKAGFSHPESPHRLASIYEMLESPSCAGHYVCVEPRPALNDEIAYVHTPHYIDFVAPTAGEVDNAFAFCASPGHHAGAGNSAGSCAAPVQGCVFRRLI